MNGQQLSLDLAGGSDQRQVPPGGFILRGVERCQSPLERQLVLAFADTPGFTWRRPFDDLWQVGRWEQLSLVLLAQPGWDIFVPDFALTTAEWRPPATLPLVVEVDGHDYHERTKDQAEHDHRRDRFMTERGAAVLRFTGREVWRDAPGCAAEVIRYAAKRRRWLRRQRVA